MKVSILVTTYNIQDYVGAAIESVVSQDMPFEWELLVGDDGSNDGTIGVIKEWIARYPDNIKLFVHERGDNVSKVGSRAAKNRAFLLERAKGDYIQFLDGDDIFLNNSKIRTQVQILDNPDNAHCACCGHNMEVLYIPTGERHLMTKEAPGDAVYNIKDYWLKHYYSTDTILFRRKCCDLLLDPLYRDYLNDNFITFIILQYGDMYYLDKAWAQYNQTGDGLWTGHSAIYGDFRNMQIYDLELNLRPDLDRAILERHQESIRRIRKTFTREHKNEIAPLVDQLQPEVFKTTLLLSKVGPLTLTEQIKKCVLFSKAEWVFFVKRIKGLYRKIKIHSNNSKR